MKILNKDNITAIEIELTTFCNAACPLCYRNYKSFQNTIYNKPYIRPLTEIISQLDEYKKLNFVMLVGSHSEPTLYSQFFDLIKYLKTRNIEIEICTNGDTHNSDRKWWNTLGILLTNNDRVYFTICGSTQELHEKYRKNTNLTNILLNAAELRKAKPIDYAQCIRFNYNSDNFNSIEFKKLVSEFSNIYMTETFYPKDINNYNNVFNITDFLPANAKYQQYKKVKDLAEKQYNSKHKGTALCQSIELTQIQIDVFGNIYPCYLFLEYMNGTLWDYNYSNIINMKYECCKFCEKHIKNYCINKKLDYII